LVSCFIRDTLEDVVTCDDPPLIYPIQGPFSETIEKGMMAGCCFTPPFFMSSPDFTQIKVLNTPAQQKLSGPSVIVNDVYEVYFDHALPRFAPAGMKVYHGRSLRGGAVLAYVCEQVITPRLYAAEKYVGLQSTSIMRLLSRGIVKDHQGFERYVFIYENNIGQPIVPAAGEPEAYGWRADQVIDVVLKPLASMLLEFHNHDMVHGGIRAQNLFTGAGDSFHFAMVGDCLTTPYLSVQPDLYLPPHLMVADPCGRGLGTLSDDLYALGVTCAVLLRTHDTTALKTREQLLISKLEMGSLSTLIESERLPPHLLELLRGLLQDDSEARWTISDVFEWFEGKRTAHKQGGRKLKASRHINIGIHKILLPSLFAYYAVQDPVESSKLVHNGEIIQWIRRSISDPKLEDRFNRSIENISEQSDTSTHFHEKLMARVAMSMAPEFPIMYKGAKFYIESLGNVLADIIFRGRDPKTVADIINDQAINFWMNIQDDIPADYNLMINRFEACQQFLKHKSIGYGFERCLYFLAPDSPCLSAAFQGLYVNSPEQLVLSLNTIADRPSRPERILDRHMVAYLSVKDRKVIDHVLPDLGSAESHRYMSAVITVLSGIQHQSRIEALPALTRWIYDQSTPLYKRYHDRDVRTMLRKKMVDLKEEGSIRKINDLLFNAERQKRDQIEFRLSCKEFQLLDQEKRYLNEALKYKDQFGTQAGHEIAALIAGVLMCLAVTGFVLVKFTQGGMWGW
jgi:hypothetical protein